MPHFSIWYMNASRFTEDSAPLWLFQKLQKPEGSFQTVGHTEAPLNTSRLAPSAGLSPTLLPLHLVLVFTVTESTCCAHHRIHLNEAKENVTCCVFDSPEAKQEEEEAEISSESLCRLIQSETHMQKNRLKSTAVRLKKLDRHPSSSGLTR